MAAILDSGSISDFATGTGTSVVVDAPTGITAGDLILVHISSESGVSLSGLASGFSALLTLDEYGGMTGAVVGKVATGSEPSSYTFTLTNSAAAWGAWSELVDGADLSSFPSSVVVGTNNAEANAASVTVTGLTLAAGDLLIGHVSSRGIGATISSNGSVMTPILATQTLGTRTTRGFHESPAAGATGTRQFDVSTSTFHTAGLLGIRAAIASPTYTGALDAAAGNASADFAGAYAPPEYIGAIVASSGASTATFAGTYNAPGYSGDLSATSGGSSAGFAGSYAVPAYAGEMAGLSGSADAAFAGSYAVPIYSGAIAAVSGPATARFTEDPPPVAAYLTGRLTIRPALTGSLTVRPALTGTLNIEPQ